MRIFLTLAAALLAFLSLAAGWLPAIGPQLAPTPTFLLYAAGLLVFAARPATTPSSAIQRGAFLGLVGSTTLGFVQQVAVDALDWPAAWVDGTWGELAHVLGAIGMN